MKKFFSEEDGVAGGDRLSLSGLGWPYTCDPFASASQVLECQVYKTMWRISKPRQSSKLEIPMTTRLSTS